MRTIFCKSISNISKRIPAIRIPASFTLLFISVVSLTYLYMDISRKENSSSVVSAQEIPLIVTWTKFWRDSLEEEMGFKSSCKVQCKVIDRDKLEFHSQRASAYLLHGPNVDPHDLPGRSPDQLVVLFVTESPMRMKRSFNQMYKVPPNYFNATMTYTRNSRYFHPFGRFELRSSGDPVDSVITQNQLLDALKRKTKGSLFFISHCYSTSNREEIIRELSKYTEITPRGKCEKILSISNDLGSASCRSDCGDNDLIATHRFYVAFENSICDDYITEKFFLRISQLLVPVVLRRQICQEAGIPPGSFIAVDDFDTLEGLGNYLNYLRKNDTAYLRYFEWTKTYRKPHTYANNALCDLCKDIYNKENLAIDDIGKNFGEDQCF